MTRALTLVLLCACSHKGDSMDAPDGSLGGAELSSVADQIRVDVYPSSRSETLLEQSWIADLSEGLSDIEIVLEPTITVSGQVVGYQSNPLAIEVPGAERTPVAAVVRVERTGTITGDSVQTDADGRFELQVPASKGYTVSITPDDGLRLPFQATIDNDIDTDLDLDVIDLGYGLPVYGHIRTDDGTGLQPLTVRLRERASGVVGPATETDSTGHYLLRAEPGAYTLEVAGGQGSALPTFEITADVSEEAGGLHLDVNVGELIPALVSGQLIAQDDAGALRDIKVRLESRALRGTIGELRIETETDGDGLFGRQILAGEWFASFIPPYDSEFGGISQPFSLSPGTGLIDIGSTVLPRRVLFEGFVIGPDGSPLANVAVNAQEVGLDGYIFSATTDEDGGFVMDVPPGNMTLTTAPAEDALAVTKWSIDPTETGQVFQVSQGEQMSGVIQGPSGPVGFALVEARTMAGELLATTLTDADGQFAVSLSPQ